MSHSNITEKESNEIINALSGGVIPKRGIPHIQVGRKGEIESIISDIEKASMDISRVRFFVGPFGSGKSFLLFLSTILSQNKQGVSALLDLDQETIFYNNSGKAKKLYSKIISSLQIKGKSNGVLESIIERWMHKNVDFDTASIDDFKKALAPMEEFLSSFNFTTVIFNYFCALKNDDDELKKNTLRWLRAEFETKSEAKKLISDVNDIIDDNSYFDYIKVLSRFIKMAGYSHFLLAIDELHVLTRIVDPTRTRNYQKILDIYNSIMNNEADNMLLYLGLTNEALENRSNGIQSYNALYSRISKSKFATEGLIDYNQPSLFISPLCVEEIFELFNKIQNVYFIGDKGKFLLSEEQIKSYLEHIHNFLGGKEFTQTREYIRDFTNLISALAQNPKARDSIIEKFKATTIEHKDDDFASL